MADTTEAPAGDAVATKNNSRRGRGGRGGAQGGNRSANDSSAPNAGERGRGRGGRRGGRGRGGNRGGRSADAGTDEAGDNAAPVSTTANRGNFGARLTGDITNTESKGKERAPEADDDEEGEVCFICASPIVHHAVSPCNHRTCHICSLRLRALYKTKACAHCRTLSDFVIFTDDLEKRYEEFSESEIASTDSNLGIKYEKAEICDDTILLLRYNCPDGSCDAACLGWPDLHRHVKSVHHKVMCDLCTRNKKVFTHEHQLFTNAELRKHEKFGDDDPGSAEQSGFKGHPECGFCMRRFYGDDELYVHCREKHERCHICDRRNGGRQPQYYVNYEALEVHFKKDHFVCPDQECLEKKFVVFESEMDLKAHQLEVHPNGLSKDARRDARRVDMSGFNLRGSQEPERRQGRGRGRGRDPNSEPLPASSAQPLRRDEIAYQRQLAIQSAQSVTARTFGGQLTSTPTEAYAARPPPSAQEPRTVTAARPRDDFPTLSSLSVNDTANQARTASPARDAPLTPQEQARTLRHNAVTERASNMLRNDQTKVAEFRQRVSFYKNGSMTAPQLIEAFFSLFDTTSAELGKLIKELAEIFEIPSKKDALLKAWNDWKAINEDYPSLPGPSGVPASSAAAVLGAGGSRVLKLKSSTAQSSRSPVGKKAGWNSTSTSLFPPLPSSTPASSSRTATGTGSANWAASAPSSTKPSPAPSRSVSQVNLTTNKKPPGGDAFPALPAAKKPASTVFSPGYNGRAVRNVKGNGPAVNAWGAGGAGSGSSTPAEAVGDEEPVVGGKKKGNKNKKQTLFHFG
ncbi:Zinc finger RING-type protein [Macrophomina phaseolina MS6]|uniref:RING-type E3 ubiquitin transferase n=1 Tax=Macrophomina phaseolina (strain MS6) TaxID=1126212 RepID=K2SCL5_MACPH|nr:Zinc finger RING-type protein [Macrophomina phaseolina MS6]